MEPVEQVNGEGNDIAPETLVLTPAQAFTWYQYHQTSNPAETQRPGQATKKKRGAPGNLFAAVRRGQRLRVETN